MWFNLAQNKFYKGLQAISLQASHLFLISLETKVQLLYQKKKKERKELNISIKALPVSLGEFF